MTIKGFSEPKRIPRIGKIYLGIKKSNGNKEYPSAVDYFVVRPDGVNTSETAAQAFHETYGPEPRELTIAFPMSFSCQHFSKGDCTASLHPLS